MRIIDFGVIHLVNFTLKFNLLVFLLFFRGNLLNFLSSWHYKNLTFAICNFLSFFYLFLTLTNHLGSVSNRFLFRREITLLHTEWLSKSFFCTAKLNWLFWIFLQLLLSCFCLLLSIEPVAVFFVYSWSSNTLISFSFLINGQSTLKLLNIRGLGLSRQFFTFHFVHTSWHRFQISSSHDNRFLIGSFLKMFCFFSILILVFFTMNRFIWIGLMVTLFDSFFCPASCY